MIQVDIQVILVIEKNTDIFVLGNIYASNFSTQNKSLFVIFFFFFFFEIITLQMLDDSISTKKEEEKNKINKITGNRTHKYSK